MSLLDQSDLRLFVLPAALIAVAAWYLQQPVPPPRSAPREPHGYAISASASPGRIAFSASAVPATPRPQVDPERPALQPLPPPPSISAVRSPIADRLHAASNSGAQDLTVVYRLLEHYREAYGAFPAGEDNATIVNALTGNNPQRLAFIDRGHPAINARGELIDRWQTPLFFHMESRDTIEVRSAGPDREMFSEDDLRHASPGMRAANESPEGRAPARP